MKYMRAMQAENDKDKQCTNGSKANAIKAIQRSQYSTGVNHINKTKAGKKALQDFVKKQCRKEVAKYGSGQLSKTVNQESVKEFSWKEILKDIQQQMPWIYSCLSGALTSRNKEDSMLEIRGNKYGAAVPVLGLTVGMLLYQCNPRKYSFLQEICSLEMWGSGSHQKLFQSFQRLGICKGKQGTLASVDRLTREFDKEIIGWREEIEERYNRYTADVTADESDGPTTEPLYDHLQNDHNYVMISPDQKFSPPMDLSPSTSMSPSVSQSTLVDLGVHLNFPSAQVHGISEEDEDLNLIDEILDYPGIASPKPSDSGETIPAIENPGYCLVWDNVQKLSTARHHTSEKQNFMHLWALCFAAKNRVNFSHLPDEKPVARVQEMPLHMFLPSEDDYSNLKIRMEVIVSRIIKDHLQVFDETNVIEHIPHQYSEESSMKSRIVNLGVIDANPSSTQGVITILDTLHNYVPKKAEDEFHTVPVHGDGLSVERMRDAKAARAASETAAARFEGIEPVPQEFHRRALLMQDTFDELYSTRSGADRGTLYQIRNAFGHNNVCSKVMRSFNHNADLLRFTTEGLATLLAMQLCGLVDQSETPPDFPEDATEREAYLTSLSQKVVDTVWQQVSGLDIAAVVDAYDDDDGEDDDDYFEYCFCKEDKEESMLKCSNKECNNGIWFHVGCVGINEDINSIDWWCSDDCKSTGRSQYCICEQYREEEEVVYCARGEHCAGYQIYHRSCLSMKRKPDWKWLCSICQNKDSRKQPRKEDHVLIYTCALLYHGLKDLAYRDAVRENDGEAIISLWKIDMPQFWQKHHNKYMIIAHKLLADVQGPKNTRLRNEIVWNRTANLHGGAAHNLPLDLVNEFLNRDFKENLKKTHGKYTDRNVSRTSKFVGTVMRDLDQAFQTRVTGAWIASHQGGHGTWKEDVVKFIMEYQEDGLFLSVPGREHSAFPGFVSLQTIDRPHKMKMRLKKYAKKLDMYRALLP